MTNARDFIGWYRNMVIEGQITVTPYAIARKPSDYLAMQESEAAPAMIDALEVWVAELEEQVIALGWDSVEQYRAATRANEKLYGKLHGYTLARAAIASATGKEQTS